MPGFHHVELWVADIRGGSFESATSEWGWLLARVGFVLSRRWAQGQTWDAGGAYLTLTTSPTVSALDHDRRRPGVNHLAVRGGSPDNVDAIMAEAVAHGWTPLYHERYPHAGGAEHYAGWLENPSGFKVEVVADA